MDALYNLRPTTLAAIVADLEYHDEEIEPLTPWAARFKQDCLDVLGQIMGRSSVDRLIEEALQTIT